MYCACAALQLDDAREKYKLAEGQIHETHGKACGKKPEAAGGHQTGQRHGSAAAEYGKLRPPVSCLCISRALPECCMLFNVMVSIGCPACLHGHAGKSPLMVVFNACHCHPEVVEYRNSIVWL